MSVGIISVYNLCKESKQIKQIMVRHDVSVLYKIVFAPRAEYCFVFFNFNSSHGDKILIKFYDHDLKCYGDSKYHNSYHEKNVSQPLA